MKSPIYILGTGLSHNGSAVLLKDGRVCVAIEKERLTRVKHDGGNDTQAINYCLEAAGIELQDLSLVVQCANFELPNPSYYRGERLFAGQDHLKVLNISHHLAHAYSAVGTAPFKECHVMVIDGCGSPLEIYRQLEKETTSILPKSIVDSRDMQCEKDSFYHFNGQTLKPLWKDFSVMSHFEEDAISLPTTKHSIGGFYAAISHYVFGTMDDAGKLMGLAPYGETGVFKTEAFTFKNASLQVTDSWKHHFTNPSTGYDYFKKYFHYYANVARWAQEQVEKAVIETFKLRLNAFPHHNICYTGGVALNAVANAKLLDTGFIKHLYMEPAAADNGLALGCAYYGWLDYLNMPKVDHTGNHCFGKCYDAPSLKSLQSLAILKDIRIQQFEDEQALLEYTAQKLTKGATVAWFQLGSEFGPRALGHRSILAHPGIEGLKNHINAHIKFREDFRPFAPAILKEKAAAYFEAGRESPYMILIDKTRADKLDDLKNVTHCDGTARVQTVDAQWNERFYNLLTEFYQQCGIPVLLNTSLNKRGMPIVETPEEAVDLFLETALDVLVIENTVFEKNTEKRTN